MNEVFPNIFIGDEMGASCKEILMRVGITKIINISGSINRFPSYFKYLKINIPDSQEYQISFQTIEKCNQFIIKALSRPGNKVLVHCHAGISRSCTFVMAYLIIHKNYTPEKALRQI